VNKVFLMIKRARKFNEIVDPILEGLSSHQKDLVHYFLVGIMSNHMPTKVLKKLQKELKEYISNFE
jgi:hypothetical protein